MLPFGFVMALGKALKYQHMGLYVSGKVVRKGE